MQALMGMPLLCMISVGPDIVEVASPPHFTQVVFVSDFSVHPAKIIVKQISTNAKSMTLRFIATIPFLLKFAV